MRILKIFELTKLSPSCYNLQHTHYVVIRDQERKERLKELAFGQYKVSSASAVVFVCGDKKHTKMLKIFTSA